MQRISSLLRRAADTIDASSFDPRITVGAFTYGVGPSTVLLFKQDDRVTIGKYCSIARGVMFIASGEHYYGRVSNYPFRARCLGEDGNSETASKGAIEVGHDVWIGAHTLVLSGVKIGHGAVIGAGSVVSKDIPPFAIAAGVPARVLRFRFDEAEVQRLLSIKWWDWSHEHILSKLALFEGDVNTFIAQSGAQ